MTTKLSILFLGLCVALFAQSPHPAQPAPIGLTPELFDVTQVTNLTSSLEVVRLERRLPVREPYLTVLNKADSPVIVFFVTGHPGVAPESIDYGESVADPDPEGLAPGATYTLRLATAGDPWQADQLEVVAAITADGHGTGQARYLRSAIAKWIGFAIQNQRIYELAKQLNTSELVTPTALDAVSEQVNNLDERLPLSIDPRLTNLVAGDSWVQFSFYVGLHNAKDGMLNRLKHIRQLNHSEQTRMAVATADLYAAKVERVNHKVRAYMERSAQ